MTDAAGQLDWLIAGGPAVEYSTDTTGNPAVLTEVTIDRVHAHDIVLTNGNRYTAARLSKSHPDGTETKLLSAEDPRVARARAGHVEVIDERAIVNPVGVSAAEVAIATVAASLGRIRRNTAEDLDEFTALRAALTHATQAVTAILATDPREAENCGHCAACLRPAHADPSSFIGNLGASRMILCGTCGNKRCPHAADHHHLCTGSNEPGQAGSTH